MRLLVLAAAAAAVDAGIGYGVLKLRDCGTTPDLAPFQAFTYRGDGGVQIITSDPDWSSEWCWDSIRAQGGAVANATMWTNTCGGSLRFTLTPDSVGPITEKKTGLCVTVADLPVYEGSSLWLQPCSPGSAAQQSFLYSSAKQQVTHYGTGKCVDAGSFVKACEAGSVSAGLPFCNTSLTIDARVADLVSRLTTQQKSTMLDTTSGGAANIGVQPYQWWNEALHGVANNIGVAFVDPTPYSTSFPMPILTSCSFNRTLWHAIGSTISTEARAFSNAGHAGLTYWAPNINMFRDPRWGRGQETPGEDPLLSGAYSKQYVSGMQLGDDPRYIKASACCKHYAGYSLELWNGTDRHHFNAVIDDADLVEYYLPAFQSCVTQGRGSSIMCSYNAVNGVPSCANGFLLSTIARGEWGFDGYVTSDCAAVSDIPFTHRYTNSTDQTAAVTLKAGMDIGCDSYLTAANVISNALSDGAITESDLDAAISHLFRVRMRLGEFDPAAQQPYTTIPPSAVCTADNLALACDAARQSIVLLSNPNGTLPLSRSAVGSVAVVGPIANASITNGGPNYNGIPCGGGPITVLEALSSASPALSVSYAAGCSNVACSSNAGFAAATAAAAAADFTVVVVGIDQTIENEGLDRVQISLPGMQNDLVTATCAAAKGPCILVVMSGGSQDISALLPSVDAAFYAGFLGGNGALALVDLVFGAAVPAGRLTQTWYPASFINEVSMFEMNVRPGPSAWPPGSNPGRTYRWYTGQPIFPFGYGLSYTTFTVSAASGPSTVSLAPVQRYLASHASWGAAFAPLESPLVASYSVNVTNTGAMDADYVLLGFLVPPGAGTNGVPLQQLFGFERVFVPAGQTVTVWLGVSARDLTTVLRDEGAATDAALPEGAPAVQRAAVPGSYTLRVGVRGPETRAEEVLEFPFVVTA